MRALDIDLLLDKQSADSLSNARSIAECDARVNRHWDGVRRATHVRRGWSSNTSSDGQQEKRDVGLILALRCTDAINYNHLADVRHLASTVILASLLTGVRTWQAAASYSFMAQPASCHLLTDNASTC